MDFIIFTHYGPRLLSVVRLTRLLVADTAVILMSFCLSRGQRRRSVFRIGGTEERGPKSRNARPEGPRQGWDSWGGAATS